MNNITREKDIYQLFDSDDINKIIRHYKVIKKRNNDNSNRYVLEQKFESYNDNIYNDTGISIKNNFRDNNEIGGHSIFDILNSEKYDSIDKLKNKLESLNQDVIREYKNNINLNDTLEESFTEEIDNIINSFDNDSKDYLYIRFAPNESQKYEQIERAFQIHNVSELYDKRKDNHYAFEEIPVYNDNLIYSNKKCKYVEDKNLDPDPESENWMINVKFENNAYIDKLKNIDKNITVKMF